MSTTAYATCPLCEAICGIAVELEGDRVVRIRGDERDPLSKGYVCPKALALEEVRTDPDRIRRPMKRIGDRWVEIGWKEALDEATERITEIRTKHGNDAVALYAGNPTLHSYSAVLFGLPLAQVLKTKNLYTSNSLDGLPRILASKLIYDSVAIVPIPDLDRTDFLLIVGANPVVSNGSVMTAPDCRGRIRDIRKRGGLVVVIDPRRTETADAADAHHFIRPGADGFVLAAMIHTVLEEKLSTPSPHLAGLDRLPSLLAPFSPERVAPISGIDASTIRSLARAFAGAKSAVCYGRIGISTQDFGTLSTWLVDVLNAITGNLDRAGGAMFCSPAIDLAAMARRFRQTGEFARWRSRVGGQPEFNNELPVGVLAEEIETEGEGQIRALVTLAGNPVLAVPNGRRLDRALAKLEYMVAIDIYRNESTRHANLILPTTFGLEHDHYPLAFHALAVRNTAHYSPAVVPRPPEVPHDWELLLELGVRLLAKRSALFRLIARPFHAIARRIGPRGFLRWGLWAGKSGLSLADLDARSEGIDLGPLVPRLPEILGGEGHRVQLAPEPLVADVARLAAKLESAEAAEAAPQNGLVLIGRRQLRDNNSWMHNSKKLLAGKNRCTLLMHPLDASAREIKSGDRVALTSRVGTIEVEVELSEEIMRGVVSLPHGWGHDRAGVQLSLATQRPGVSINDITDDQRFDVLSGCTSFSGLEVSVARTR